MSHLLLVEDDMSLGKTLQERLVKEGYQVEWVRGQKEAEEKIVDTSFDLYILDVGLENGSGFKLAKNIKKQKSAPFIFMTAASGAENRLQGFELGAEEFIPKPFHLKELLLRVKHVLENHSDTQMIHVAGVNIDFSSMVIRHSSGSLSGQEISLTKKENMILSILIEKSPKVVSRDDLLDQVWGEGEYPSNRTIDNIIMKLRQVLGDEVGGYIQSIRGVGYKWWIDNKN